MAIVLIDVGDAPRDGEGDSLRAAFLKINAALTELDERMVAIASQAEAEAGAATNRLMTPLRTAQAIAANASVFYQPPVSSALSFTVTAAHHRARLRFDGGDDTTPVTVTFAAALPAGFWCTVKRYGTDVGEIDLNVAGGGEFLTVLQGYTRITAQNGEIRAIVEVNPGGNAPVISLDGPLGPA